MPGLKRRIMYVDDHEDSCELVGLMLQMADSAYDTICVTTAEEALQRIKNETFDIYILDYRIPDTSGVELCRIIRSRGITSPVVFFTAMGHARDREAAAKAGANAYLLKPNDLHILTETVADLLARQTSPNGQTKSRKRHSTGNSSK
jgi:two-component system, OmpR family, manganese sensing response regulator